MKSIIIRMLGVVVIGCGAVSAQVAANPPAEKSAPASASQSNAAPVKANAKIKDWEARQMLQKKDREGLEAWKRQYKRDRAVKFRKRMAERKAEKEKQRSPAPRVENKPDSKKASEKEVNGK